MYDQDNMERFTGIDLGMGYIHAFFYDSNRHMTHVTKVIFGQLTSNFEEIL